MTIDSEVAKLDFFSQFVEIGGLKKGWRSPLAIVCLLAGLGAGIYLGQEIEPMWKTAGLGALLGWLLGMFLRGIGVFLLIFAGVVIVILGYERLISFFG